MIIKTILFQVERDGEWIGGYYVGEYDGSDKSIILTGDFKAYEGEIWDYKADYKINISF